MSILLKHFVLPLLAVLIVREATHPTWSFTTKLVQTSLAALIVLCVWALLYFSEIAVTLEVPDSTPRIDHLQRHGKRFAIKYEVEIPK